MTLYRLLLYFIASTLSVPLLSQYTKSVEIGVQCVYFSTDQDGNLYYASQDSLVKLVPPYHHFYSYRFRQSGVPDYIDVSNPSQIVCLYRDLQKVILLDSSLRTMLRPFYLDELGLYDIYAAVSSAGQGLWFYDIFTNSLIKFNKNFMPLVRSADLNPYFTKSQQPSFLTEQEDELYIDVPGTSILVFDQNGNFSTSLNLQGVPDFQVLGKSIYYYRDNMIIELNKISLKQKMIFLPPEPGIINAHFHPGYLFVQTQGKIIIYKENKEE